METTKMIDGLPVMRTPQSIAGLREMCEYMKSIDPVKDYTVAEIGVFLGDATRVFLEYFKTVYCVDPWDNNRGDITDICNMDKVYDHFIDRFVSNPRVMVLRLPSTAAARVLTEDTKFNMVYIDALHTFDSVRWDIESWLPLIRRPGWIAGHDYSERFPGVVDAVNQTIGKPDKVLPDMSWVKRV